MLSTMEGDPQRILVIEDDALLIEEMKQEFRKHNFSVAFAEDGETGLAKVFQWKPNLILLDIVVPKVNGMEFLQKLSEDPWAKNLPVIVLTNMTDSTNMAQVLELGKYDYLVKADWSLSDLIAKINEKLNVAV